MGDAARLSRWVFGPVSLLMLLLTAQGLDIPMTILNEFVDKGAVLLDGGPPAFHVSEGSGAGVNNWILFFEGGGWCNNVTTCFARRDTRLGSYKHMTKTVTFSGFLSGDKRYNPDFFNWNKVRVRYCDGASYTGDVEAVDPATKLYFRGARIFQAIIDNVLNRGMKNAENAILAGCSAGGLTTILHCDRFKSLLPPKTKVKCLADAGYFINAKDVSGASSIQEFYSQVAATHNSAKNLPPSCTSKIDPGLCFFPENVVPTIETPIFILNAVYDSWQIKNILAPGIADPHETWRNCKSDIKKCSPDQIKAMQDFRMQFLAAFSGVNSSEARGWFIDSCYAHCQLGTQETWLRNGSPLLARTTIAQAVGDWYYDRRPFKEIDCPYPCNPTCHNRIFDTGAKIEHVDL